MIYITAYATTPTSYQERPVLHRGLHSVRSPSGPPRVQDNPHPRQAMDGPTGRHEDLAARVLPARVYSGCSASVRGLPSTGSVQVDDRRRPRSGDRVRLGPGAPATRYSFAPARDVGCARGDVVLSRVGAVGRPAILVDYAGELYSLYVAHWMEWV